MEKTWAVQDAKARFSEVVRAAESAPQRITKNGEEKAVVISAAEYRRLTDKKSLKTKTLLEALRACPYEFEIPPRSKDRGRDIKL